MSERSYNHARVQEYWQYVWDEHGAYELPEGATDPTYVLGMFPYTSGTLHMGHVRNYAITDAYARFRRMNGDDVLHPMGWDAFGLPAENAAYERYTDPKSWTDACIEQMREEMKTLGFGYDFSRELATCEPEYYRWNQYFFRKFYEAGLVEYKGATVNWCPDCETVLADAQVDLRNGESAASAESTSNGPGRQTTGRIDPQRRTHPAARRNKLETAQAGDTTGVGGGNGGDVGAFTGPREVCWRCETPVTRRELDQWFFTITDYAEELLDGLDELTGWPDSVREIQRNWIGKREGAKVTFEVSDFGEVEVFTTRLDTIGGATYLAVSPGHELAGQLAESDEAVAEYCDGVRGRSTSHDAGERAEFTGVETDLEAIHPVTGEPIPVYVASYVLDDVGTGAIMGVPAHNERDWAFAHEMDLPIERVIEPLSDATGEGQADKPFTAEGMVTNSGEYDGLASSAARERLLEKLDVATSAVTYRLRDWLISRQRYWGTPIPIVHCDACGPVLVPESELPVELPEFVQTRGNPLAGADSFVETDCPECGEPAERETDTMDTFVDSSWYFLRFLDPEAPDVPFDRERADEWLPVDVYVGGEEHAVLHLLYLRFFTRALADVGLLSVREPVERLINQGTVLHSGEKMSKTRENVISPHEYGAETTRLFVLSAAHPAQDFEWTARDIGSSYDLQQQLFAIADGFELVDVHDGQRRPHDDYVDREIDRTIAAATDQYERFRFHRVVSEVRGLLGLLGQYRDYGERTVHEGVYRRGLLVLARLVAPLTPFLAEEMWNRVRGEGIVATAKWPEPAADIERYDVERRVVETLRDDVRDIFEVAGIEDADEIEIVVAPEWKYRAYELARSADEHEAVVGRILGDDAITAADERARAYAETLQERRHEPAPILSAEIERDVLSRASWLLTDEFDVDVRVLAGDEADNDMLATAEPGKPAILIR